MEAAMRSVNIGGQVFTVKPMTRGQLRRAQREQGIDYFNLDTSKAFAAKCYAFDCVFGESDIEHIDGLLEPDTQPLFDAIMAETFGSRIEEKNLSGSGAGSQTANE
jgi:hypothetical protein